MLWPASATIPSATRKPSSRSMTPSWRRTEEARELCRDASASLSGRVGGTPDLLFRHQHHPAAASRELRAGRGGGHRKESRPADPAGLQSAARSEEHTSELQSLAYLVCRLLLEK